ncbi:MAG: hypothetical protein U0V56_05975 [Actinomycetota bacterium]
MSVAALREGEAAAGRCLRHVTIDLVRLATSSATASSSGTAAAGA